MSWAESVARLNAERSREVEELWQTVADAGLSPRSEARLRVDDCLMADGSLDPLAVQRVIAGLVLQRNLALGLVVQYRDASKKEEPRP